MKKNFKKIIMATTVAAVLMACGSNAKAVETTKAEADSTVAESVEADKAGMSIDPSAAPSSDMSAEMPNLPGAENGKVKSVTDNVIRIERISYVGNEVQSSESGESKEETPEEVDLLTDPSGIKYVDMATGLVSDAPKAGD